MFSSSFKYRHGSALARGLGKIGKAYEHSKSALAWILFVSAFQVISCWTNVIGLSMVLPMTAGIILGVGIQGMALYAGIGLIGSNEDNRGGWMRLLVPVVGLSVFFSYLGFASNYLSDQERRAAPLQARDDLKAQALGLSSSVNDARRLAGAIYANRIDFSKSVINRVNSRLATSDYKNPAEGMAMIEQMKSEVASAKEAQKQWDAFKFDASTALNEPSVPVAFTKLQDAHTELGRLVGLLRKDESKGFNMPPPPMPSLREAETTQAKTPLQLATAELLTIPGLAWLALALLLEAVPLMAAHATSQSKTIDGEEVTPGTEKSLFGVQATGEYDTHFAREISKFNALLRPAHFAGANTTQEVEEQSQRIDHVASEYRKGVVEQLRLMALEKQIEVRRAQLELLVSEARKYGVPEAELNKIVEEQWHELLGDFHIETLRLERSRDEKRENVLSPQANT